MRTAKRAETTSAAEVISDRADRSIETHEARADAGTSVHDDELALQRRYHDDLFGALGAGEVLVDRLRELLGGAQVLEALGVDQMGHFGPNGCELLAEQVVARSNGSPRLIEIGSGYGGSLRDVVRRLRRAGVLPARAIGVELIEAFARAGRRIEVSLGGPDRVHWLVADARALPLADRTVDFVLLAGSMPHLQDPGSALREMHRVLAPGGFLVFTEEVSLFLDPERVSRRFAASHPLEVFRYTTRAERRKAIAEAGLELVDERDLRLWSACLFRDRLKALRLIRGSMELAFGPASTARMAEALEAAALEACRGSLLPALFVACRPEESG